MRKKPVCNVEKKRRKEKDMNYAQKVLDFLKWFWRFHFVIKLNVVALVFAIGSFVFGSATFVDSLWFVLLVNLYALPIYIVILRQMNVNESLLISLFAVIFILGYFVSFYIPLIVWVGSIVFLFRQEIEKIVKSIRKN